MRNIPLISVFFVVNSVREKGSFVLTLNVRIKSFAVDKTDVKTYDIHVLWRRGLFVVLPVKDVVFGTGLLPSFVLVDKELLVRDRFHLGHHLLALDNVMMGDGLIVDDISNLIRLRCIDNIVAGGCSRQR